METPKCNCGTNWFCCEKQGNYFTGLEKETERLKIRDELLFQLLAQVAEYYGGIGGLADLQDGHRQLMKMLGHAFTENHQHPVAKRACTLCDKTNKLLLTVGR